MSTSHSLLGITTSLLYGWSQRLVLVCLSISLYFATTVTSHATPERLDSLMQSAEFEADAKLSNTLMDFFLGESRSIISTNVNAMRQLQHGYDTRQTVDLWLDHVKPACERLTNTYAAIYRWDVNQGGFDASVRFHELIESFREQFDAQLFDRCRDYETFIEEFVSGDVGVQFQMPKMLARYADDASNISDSIIALSKALVEQGSGRYTSRLAQAHQIEVFLYWLEKLDAQLPQEAEWRQKYQDIQDQWQSMMQNNRNNEAMFAKSRFDEDSYKEGDGDSLRATVSALIAEKYDVVPNRVFLQENSMNENLDRLAVANGGLFGKDALEGERYQSIYFHMALEQGKDVFSTHRGWYEHVDGQEPTVVFFALDQNFRKPRTDQLVSTAKRVTAAEQRAATSARIDAEIKANKEETDRRVAEQVAAAKAEAEQASKEALADAQAQLNAAETQTQGGFKLLGMISSLLLLIGGVITAATGIKGRISSEQADKLDAVLLKLTAATLPIGTALLVLGGLGIVASLTQFSIVGFFTGLLSLTVGALLAKKLIVTLHGSTKSLLDRVEAWANPIGILGLVFGLYGLLASLL